MGCTASVVLLQALRSLLRGSCARARSRQQERISLDVPLLQDGEEADSRPRTIIIMMRVSLLRLSLFNVLGCTVTSMSWLSLWRKF
ncbi:hypothetical protein AOLI_G00218770 [Acnodon oligacanthus]